MNAVSVSPTTLRRPWLQLARVGWWCIAVLAVATFIVVLAHIAAAPVTCAAAAGCNPSLFTQVDAALIEGMGLPARAFLAFEIAAILIGRFSLFAVAILIFWKRSDDWVALMLSAALIASLVEGGAPASLGIFSVIANVLYFIATFLFIPLPFVFPNGIHVPRWTRWVGFPMAFAIALASLLGDPLAGVFGLLTIVWLALAAYAMLYRYRRSATPAQREQIKWALLGIACTFLVVPGFVALTALLPPAQPSTARLMVLTLNGVLYVLAYAGAAICLTIAMLRHHLWGADVVLNRALVYGALTAFVLLAYVLIAGGLGALFQTSGNVVFAFIATAVIALLINPLRLRFQRAVNRLMYGERDDPYTVLTQLRQRLDLAVAPQSVLPAITETVTKMLKLPYAAISMNGVIVALHGSAPALNTLEAFPLTYQGENIGTLDVAPRAGERFTLDERRLLANIAAQAGVAARAVQLSGELQQARERLVNAREEERRRLRRDLHDGLGPKLAGQALILEAVRDSLPADAGQQRVLIDHLIEDSQTVVNDVRQLVHGLRPPALDQLGLADAIRSLATKLEAAGVQVSCTVPEPLPELPAAVEVAAYRITQEALTNVMKHAQAHTCAISVSIENGGLRLQIRDDGIGLTEQVQRGVGLNSMRERAEEIGGSLELMSIHPGAQVIAVLPISNPKTRPDPVEGS